MNCQTVTLTETLDLSSTCLAIGFFDGLHRGHQKLIQAVLASKLTPAILTFSPDMKSLLSKKPKELLLTPEEKDAMLATLGIQKEYVLPFTPEVRNASVEDFLAFLRRSHVQEVVVGDDFTFSRMGQGKVNDLLTLRKDGILVRPLSLLLDSGVKVSSTSIKDYLKQGDIVAANNLLGYNFYLEGIVQHGLMNGRKIGFPTANLNPQPNKVLPARGVYKTKTSIDGFVFSSMTYIGKHPTIEKLSQDLIETNILGFKGDLYGQKIVVTFLDHIRSDVTFGSLEELKEQLKKDALQAKD